MLTQLLTMTTTHKFSSQELLAMTSHNLRVCLVNDDFREGEFTGIETYEL